MSMKLRNRNIALWSGELFKRKGWGDGSRTWSNMYNLNIHCSNIVHRTKALRWCKSLSSMAKEYSAGITTWNIHDGRRAWSNTWMSNSYVPETISNRHKGRCSQWRSAALWALFLPVHRVSHDFQTRWRLLRDCTSQVLDPGSTQQTNGRTEHNFS